MLLTLKLYTCKQHYVIKFVSDLRQVGDTLIFSTIKTDRHDITGFLRCFNATFNNISVISWGSVLLMEETGIPEKTPTCHKPLTNFIT